MAWQLSVHIGMFFSELAAYDGSTMKTARWATRSVSLKKALQDFQQQHNISPQKVYVISEQSKNILQRRIGEDMALLVTTGFESWPQLRQPVLPQNFTTELSRVVPLLGQDYIFGINERTLADGNIKTPVDLSELEFIASKLELLEIKKIAVGFLHSNKNPSNEQTVVNYFSAKGFQVSPSHLCLGAGQEVARWWRSILDLYLDTVYEQEQEQIRAVFGPLTSVEYLTSEGHLRNQSKPNFAAHFGLQQCVLTSIKAQAKPAKKKAKATWIAHLDWDEFNVFSMNEQLDVLQTSLGPISIQHSEELAIQAQPLQALHLSPWQTLSCKGISQLSDPGPMIMRGQQPLALDALFLAAQDSHSQEKFFAGFSPTPIVEKTIRSSILSLDRQNQIVSLDQSIHDFSNWFWNHLALEIAASGRVQHLIVAGPLAELALPALKKFSHCFTLEHIQSHFVEDLVLQKVDHLDLTDLTSEAA